MRQRLGEYDLVRAFGGRMPRPLIQIGFGLVCFGAAVIARAGLDTVAPGAGPFALLYLAVLISTLYGRLLAGLTTWVAGLLHAWYAILPIVHSFTVEHPEDAPRAMVNGAVALLIVVIASLFRRAVNRAATARDTELDTHQLLMRELEHRTKNNFAMVAGLLNLQRRNTSSEDVRDALAAAAARVSSFSAIHESIYTTSRYSEQIDIRQYLDTLTSQLQAALFPNARVRVALDCAPSMVARDRALNFGMIVAELVTNASKHAFPDGRAGRISVAYAAPEGAPWTLTVTDDGVGRTAGDGAERSQSGIGSRLVEAFASAVEGVIVTDHPGTGTQVRLTQAPIDGGV